MVRLVLQSKCIMSQILECLNEQDTITILRTSVLQYQNLLKMFTYLPKDNEGICQAAKSI